ncbi:ABC transporter ATP-binding protein [Schaalia sp. 19OD2882]|nr:ABC transporter ATP-binding protein [Schaalia sp. 19OD2882]
MLEARAVTKDWGQVRVLHGVDLAVAPGEFVAVMGPSGSGKSTLMHMLGGVDVPTSGQVMLDGEDLSAADEETRAARRLRTLGFVFQKPEFLPTLDIGDNVALPGLVARTHPRPEVLARVEQLMDSVGVGHLSRHRVDEVSGGQLQRAAICRALVNEPQLLLGDEPTGALNRASAAEVLDVLGAINAAGTAIILVTHDASVAARADRVVVLVDGRVAEEVHLGRDSGADRHVRLARVSEVLAAHGV